MEFLSVLDFGRDLLLATCMDDFNKDSEFSAAAQNFILDSPQPANAALATVGAMSFC